MQHKTILITGGTSGIGLELVKLLAPTNRIVFCARNADMVAKTQKEIPNTLGITADIQSDNDVKKLYHQINERYGMLNVLMANAGVANFVDYNDPLPSNSLIDMDINFGGTVKLINQFLPLLRSSENPAVILTSSILAKVPVHSMPIYSASKAALHSYSQSLRAQLPFLRVVEVLPPLVDTPLAAAIKTNDKLSPKAVAQKIIGDFEKGKTEIYPGRAVIANFMSRLAPKKIEKMLNSL